MLDVFISYARSTQSQAELVAESLRSLGYSVWRDDQLPAHLAYSDVIEERLATAKAVVVIWSAEATRSEWVRSEANRAREARKIVQLSVDGTTLPMPFDQIQCADLSNWAGEVDTPGWKKVVASVAALVGGEGALPRDGPLSPGRETLRAQRSTNNLPSQLTSFVGREREIQEISAMLESSRLVTLAGSGGCGKTRLALRIGADFADRVADGVWFVELAPLTDPGLVPQAVASTLGVKEQPGLSITDALTREVKGKELLLILDNCEHVVAASALLCQSLLSSCPRVRILASSREALRVAGEVPYRVPSLATPSPKSAFDAETLAQYAAVQLFIDRVRAVRPTFGVDSSNAAAVASICHRLDGIPLAIELAAARLRSLSVDEVNNRLDQRFRVLTSGVRTVLPRQQTLRAMIDWSYDLLSDAEKALLLRVSVFSGGWTLDAAEQACSHEREDDGAVVDLLTALADKSLAVAEERDGVTRYRLPETVLHYARDRLRESGEEMYWQKRHFAHFLRVMEETDPRLDMDSKAAARLETEHDNLRAALTWSMAPGGDALGGMKLASLLWWFWMICGHLGEGRGWLRAVLAAAPPGHAAELRSKVLYGAGRLALAQDDYVSAQPLFEESLAICRKLGSHNCIANALRSMGSMASSRGDYSTARTLYEESLAISREQGEWIGAAATIGNLGRLSLEQQDFPAARERCEESLAIWRRLGNRRGAALALGFLGQVDFHLGEYQAARRNYEESLASLREQGGPPVLAMLLTFLAELNSTQGDHASARALYLEALHTQRQTGDRLSIAASLEGLALVALRLDEHERAARVWGGAERLREEIGAPLAPVDRSRYDRNLSAVRAALTDQSVFDKAWQEGRAMTLEQAIEHALSMG
jgi:predicted ATPase